MKLIIALALALNFSAFAETENAEHFENANAVYVCTYHGSGSNIPGVISDAALHPVTRSGYSVCQADANARVACYSTYRSCYFRGCRRQ